MQPTKPSVPLSSALEDYLEAIYHLEQERRIARVRDIAKRLGVKMSSVSSALKSLGARGLIEYDPHQFITLTDQGIETAREIVRRHEVLKRFLSKVLRFDEVAAEDNACRIEHHLDPEVIDRLVKFVEFMETCPVDQTRWHEDVPQTCDECVTCLEEARKKTASRARAQKAAVKEGRTLAEIDLGSQVMIDSVTGTDELRQRLSDHQIEVGVIIEVESKDQQSGDLRLNVKGYHVTLPAREACMVRVKPI